MNRLLFPLLLLLMVQSITAQISGRVVGVTDGDTITVLAAGNKQIKVRLAGIEAPEKGQDFSDKAKRYLSDLVIGKEVRLEGSKIDRYGRLVAKAIMGKIDVGKTLVHAGLAWHFKRYEKEQSPDDRMIYAAAEKAARNLKWGIWSMPNPMPPQEFRSSK